jgi:PAS domain S-box-containing protein
MTRATSTAGPAFMIFNFFKDKFSMRIRLSLKALLLIVMITVACLELYGKAGMISAAIKNIDAIYADKVEADSFASITEDMIMSYMRASRSSLMPSDLDKDFDRVEKYASTMKSLPDKIGHKISSDIFNGESALQRARSYYKEGRASEAREEFYKSYSFVEDLYMTGRDFRDFQDLRFREERHLKRPAIIGNPYEQLWILIGCLGFVLLVGLSLIFEILMPLKGVAERMVLASKDPANAQSYIVKNPRLDELGVIQLALNNLLIEVEQNIKRSLQAEDLAQQRLAAIEAAGDGIGIVNKEGILIYANQSLLDLHGIESIDAVNYIGHSWRNLYSGEGQDIIESSILPEIERTGVWRGESRVIRKDGGRAMAEMSLTRLENGGLIGTAKDVTARISAEAEREELQKQFTQVQKLEAVGRLTGGIAHDFNNMLTIVSGNIDMIAGRFEADSDVGDYVQSAKRAIMRGSELTQRLLAFSRSQTLNPKTIDLNALIPEATMMIIRAIGEQVEIIFNLSESLWLTRLDVGQFENALINLAINARDAMPQGGYIKIRTENRVLREGDRIHQGNIIPGEYVMVEITDTGWGIPENQRSQIFDPFFTTKGVGKGSGLGLSMVYGFVKQSSGHIEVESQVHVGTAFRLYFPRVVQQHADSIRDPAAFEPQAEHDLNGVETILIVEDESEILQLNKKILEKYGYTLYCAADGREALAIAESLDHIDLLVTDIVMPGNLNGYDLANQMKKQFAHLKTLFISGYAPAQILEAEDAAHINLLSKPYVSQQLVERVRAILDQA